MRTSRSETVHHLVDMPRELPVGILYPFLSREQQVDGLIKAISILDPTLVHTLYGQWNDIGYILEGNFLETNNFLEPEKQIFDSKMLV